MRKERSEMLDFRLDLNFSDFHSFTCILDLLCDFPLDYMLFYFWVLINICIFLNCVYIIRMN